ncbi:MAG: hypothetical protein P8X63_13635 [Desulfuromonadaceae bacterium]
MAENSSRDETYIDQLVRRIKNNKFFALLILLGLTVTALANFKEDLEKLLPNQATQQAEPAVSPEATAIEFAGQKWLKSGFGHVSVSEDQAEINDELILSSHQGEILLWSERTVNLEQISFMVQCELISQAQTKGWGLVWGLENPHNFYYFAVNNQRQFRLLRFQQGQPKVLIPWTGSPSLAAGAGKNQSLGIAIHENRVQLLVNHKTVTEYAVEQPAIGSVGFYVEARGLTVRYRDVRFAHR